MKPTSLVTILLAGCLACTNTKTETIVKTDTTVLQSDTATVETKAVETATSSILYDSASGNALVVENGETVYVSPKQYSFISDPYDFSLDAGTIEGLLGEEAKTKVIETEAGEDYGAYSYYTITFKDSEISFYSYSGKHFSTITTPLLPLKKGIKIGMKKDAFQTAMSFDGEDASKATTYRLTDDYGHMDFSFRADTLNLIYAYYEEGD